jgi:hypothetical protein
MGSSFLRYNSRASCFLLNLEQTFSFFAGGGWSEGWRGVGEGWVANRFLN